MITNPEKREPKFLEEITLQPNYLVEFTLRPSFFQQNKPEQQLELLRAEFDHGEMLQKKGIRIAVYASIGKLWAAYAAESESVLEEILREFPLYKYNNMEIANLIPNVRP